MTTRVDLRIFPRHAVGNVVNAGRFSVSLRGVGDCAVGGASGDAGAGGLVPPQRRWRDVR